MWFRSPVTLRGWLCLIMAFAAIQCIDAPRPARAEKLQPSPFAGEYCQGGLHFSISDSGRIDGGTGSLFITISYRGRISNDGVIELAITQVWTSPTPTLGKSFSKFTDRAVGLAALDADGNLYGVLEYEDGGLLILDWLRCD
jgi:hypothetical protein